MSQATRKVSSRNSNKENQRPSNVPRLTHCKIDMTKESLVCSFGAPARKTSTPANAGHSNKHSLEKVGHFDSGFNTHSRPSLQLTKSSTKLAKEGPFFPATSKHNAASKRSLPKREEPRSQLGLRGILNNSLLEISKAEYPQIYEKLDGLLGEFEGQASLSDRETIGFVRLIVDKIKEKSAAHDRQRNEALEESQQMGTLFREELRRKNKELLWLRQQVESRQHPASHEETPKSSTLSDFSMCSYLGEQQTLPCKTLDDDLKTKLRLDFNKIKEYRQSEEYRSGLSD